MSVRGSHGRILLCETLTIRKIKIQERRVVLAITVEGRKQSLRKNQEKLAVI